LIVCKTAASFIAVTTKDDVGDQLFIGIEFWIATPTSLPMTDEAMKEQTISSIKGAEKSRISIERKLRKRVGLH